MHTGLFGGRLLAMAAAISAGVRAIPLTMPPMMPTPPKVSRRRPGPRPRSSYFAGSRLYTGNGKREIARRLAQAAMQHDDYEGHPVHVLQRNSHPNGLPNHCLGLPSGMTTRGASIATREEANKESW